MKFDNFTIKSQEAVQKALEMAANGGQQAVGTLHLLAGVLVVGENVTQFLFGQTGVNSKSFTDVYQVLCRRTEIKFFLNSYFSSPKRI